MNDINFDQLKGFLALSLRERNTLRAIVNGQHFTTACATFGLNASRTKRNAKFMGVLYSAQKERDKIPTRGTEPGRPVEPQGDIYQQALALEKEMESWPADHREAYEAGMKRGRAEADAKALADWLAGKLCKACGKPAELKFGAEAWCRACREFPALKPETAEVKPARAELTKPAPVEPPEERQIGAATRAAITTALVHNFWQRERAREVEPGCPNCGRQNCGGWCTTLPCFR